jgi:hypothetical protein
MKITLDKERTLKFDMNAMRLFEEEAKFPIFEMSEKMSATSILIFTWACLVHEDKNLTIDYVGSFITMENMEEVSKAISELMLVKKNIL